MKKLKDIEIENRIPDYCTDLCPEFIAAAETSHSSCTTDGHIEITEKIIVTCRYSKSCNWAIAQYKAQ